VDWIDLAQDRDQWMAFGHTVMNIRVPIKCWAVLEWLHNWRLLKKGSAPYVNKYLVLEGESWVAS
jgi:hypothetical protein